MKLCVYGRDLAIRGLVIRSFDYSQTSKRGKTTDMKGIIIVLAEFLSEIWGLLFKDHRNITPANCEGNLYIKAKLIAKKWTKHQQIQKSINNIAYRVVTNTCAAFQEKKPTHLLETWLYNHLLHLILIFLNLLQTYFWCLFGVLYPCILYNKHIFCA